jgi:RND family efflux transporter MFP subunit
MHPMLSQSNHESVFYALPDMIRSFGRRLIATCLFLVVALAGGCDGGRKVASVTPPPVVVTVAQPVQREVTECINYTGTTQALEYVEVRARVKGFLDQIRFQPRARVKKNDVLFVIDPRPYQNALDKAVAALAARKADLEQADFQVKKIARLIRENAAAEDERVDSQSKYDAALAGISSAEAAVAEARLNLEYCHVAAPISGRISRNMIDAGNLVEPSTTLLATIANDDFVYAYFDVSESDALRFRKAHAAAIRTAATLPFASAPAYLGLMNEAGYPHEGFIDYIAPTMDGSTGTVQVRAKFPNQEGFLMAGLFGRVRVPISRPRPALMVAEQALAMDQGQRYVLVVNDRKQVEYRRVKEVILDEGLRVIEEGVGPKDWVIVSGLQRVRPGATVTPQPTSMTALAGAATRPAAAPSVRSPASQKSVR